MSRDECINCGSLRGGYVTNNDEGTLEEVGPFCRLCWDGLIDFFELYLAALLQERRSAAQGLLGDPAQEKP